MRVLVTGGGGFIGSHLVERLLHEGHEVRILDSFATGRRENIAHLGDAELIEGDVQSYERAHTASVGCEVVFHQAALPSVPRSVQDPLMTNVVNVTGTLNVLLAARDNGARRVVYASSSSVYGPTEVLPKEESQTPAPISPYAVSKLAGEGYCRAFSSIYGLNCVALRYFNVFGPRQDPTSQYSAVIPKFITASLRGLRPVIFGDGHQSRDFTYVDNVVDANLLAMESPSAPGQVLNIACGERISLNQMLADLGDVLGKSIEAEYRNPRPGDVAHSLADITRARQMLGYEPVVSMTAGLRLTLESIANSPDAASLLSS
jgi:UDP-glucose 4-epimerase